MIDLRIPEIINETDFKEFYSLVYYDDARVKSAIKYSFLIIDAVCNSAISNKWDLVGDVIGFTDDQKQKITKAMLAQTQYVLANNMDLSQNAKSVGIGGFSFSQNNSQYMALLSQSAKNYLISAKVLYGSQFSGVRTSKSAEEDELEPSILEPYIKKEIGDQRYVLTQQLEDGHKGKYLYFNENGMAEYRKISISEDYLKSIAIVDNKLIITDKNDKQTIFELKTINNNSLIGEGNITVEPEKYLVSANFENNILTLTNNVSDTINVDITGGSNVYKFNADTIDYTIPDTTTTITIPTIKSETAKELYSKINDGIRILACWQENLSGQTGKGFRFYNFYRVELKLVEYTRYIESESSPTWKTKARFTLIFTPKNETNTKIRVYYDYDYETDTVSTTAYQFTEGE